MKEKVDLQKLKPEQFPGLIAETETAYPYLRHTKKGVNLILNCIVRTPCFLPGKPTPLTSVLGFLRTVVGNSVERDDVIFVLVAVGAIVGVRTSSTRSSFKVFPGAVDSPEWEQFFITSREDAEKLAFAMSDVMQPTKAEAANAQSCTNKLLKRFELYMKAMELYRLKLEGKSFAQAKQALPTMADREYTQALRLLNDMGLINQRQTMRLGATVLSAQNAAYVNAESERLGLSSSQVINQLLDQIRLNPQPQK